MRKRIKYVYLSERVIGKVFNCMFFLNNRIHYKQTGMDLLKKNADFKGKLKGKKCFIIGNGPSLNQQDLSRLKNEFVITCNTAVQLDQFEVMQPNAHFWSDDCFFAEEYVEYMKAVNSKSKEIISFFPLKQKDFIEKYRINLEIPTRYFNYRYIFNESYKKSMDFCDTLIQGFSVVEFGIALAVYMEASEIYLLGCDCTSAISHIRYMENHQDTLFEYAYGFSKAEANERIKIEMERGNEDFFYNQLKIFHHYRLWNDYCVKRGINLYNCTGSVK